MIYSNTRRKKKKQSNRGLLILIIFALLFYFAFNLGLSKNQGNLNYCYGELNSFSDKFKKAEEEKTKLQESIERVEIEKNIIQDKYEKIAMSEEASNLFDEINAKVSAGMDINRIKRVVDSLKTDRKCSNVVSKRFIVKTPLYKGDIKNTNVSFEKKMFEITADGYSFINDNKKPESWFDITKPISISFNIKEGVEIIKQELPIKKSFIFEGKEYFFSVDKSSARGFVDISEYYCNYP